MTVNAHRRGSLVTLTGRFYSDAAKTTLADPTTAVLTIRDPSGVVTTPSPIVSGGVGIRTYGWDTTAVLRGMHDVRWVGTGAVATADQEAVFILEDFTLGSDLTTVANVRAAIGITGSSSDPLIQDLITAVSAAIQMRYQREFAPATGTPTRRVRSDGRLIQLAPYDLRSASSITLDPAGTPVALLATDWRLGVVDLGGTYQSLRLRNTYSLSNRSFTDYGYYEVDITGTWGFAQVPSDVARACILTVAAWLDRGADEIAGMDATVRPDGSTMSSSWAIPTAAHRLLQPYERHVF